jgi:glycerol-3-phosphate dehydrogenase (NAD(P)+)
MSERGTSNLIARAVVIGAGSWGTTLAVQLGERGVHTTLWCRSAERARELRQARENRRYLPGIQLPSALEVTADPQAAAQGAELAVTAVPTQFLRSALQVFEELLPGATPVVSATKGIEIETFRTPSHILTEVLGERPVCVLTGPSHAEEIARGLPASLVAASQDAFLAKTVQAVLGGPRLRIYTNDDVVGAELAGALKNVTAIAAGISDGLGLGDNAKSALMVRGMVEMARFGKSLGAKPGTFFGLAGFGDLVTTCCSRHSRNRALGERVGRGESLQQVLSTMDMVAEGVWTTRALFGPEADPPEVEMPIAEQVHAVLFEGKAPREAVNDLMTRAASGEMDGIA